MAEYTRSEATEVGIRNAFILAGIDPSRADDAIIRVRRDAAREAAQMIRDACDRWEVDGDDERLVNEVLDPWTTRTLTPEEAP